MLTLLAEKKEQLQPRTPLHTLLPGWPGHLHLSLVQGDTWEQGQSSELQS